MRTKINNGYLADVTIEDSDFIADLFTDPDVQQFFILTTEHQKRKALFINHLINANANRTGINCIVYHDFQDKVGLVTAELYKNSNTDEVMWNLSYAIAPEWRNSGYATNALSGFTAYLESHFSIPVSLDIADSNVISTVVASKCGYSKPSEPGKRAVYFDPEHMEIGPRYKWYREQQSKRIQYFQAAVQAYKNRDYQTSIKLYTQALNESYVVNTPFTDAQILSNLGMSHSSVGNYTTAYSCLMQAKSLGLTNNQIESELLWLKTNAGL